MQNIELSKSSKMFYGNRWKTALARDLGLTFASVQHMNKHNKITKSNSKHIKLLFAVKATLKMAKMLDEFVDSAKDVDSHVLIKNIKCNNELIIRKLEDALHEEE